MLAVRAVTSVDLELMLVGRLDVTPGCCVHHVKVGLRTRVSFKSRASPSAVSVLVWLFAPANTGKKHVADLLIQAAPPPLSSGSAAFMRRRFEQTHEKIKRKTGEFNLLLVSWADGVSTRRKWSGKHGNWLCEASGTRPTGVHSHRRKLTVLTSGF